MKPIPLTRGQVAWVDDEDYEHLMQWKWQCNSDGYASRNDRSQGRQRTIGMHREIMRPERGLEVDHINGDKLMNVRSNLRLATRRQNILNRGPQKNNLSGFKGLWWYQLKARWVVRVKITRNGQTIKKTGRYKTLAEAIAGHAQFVAALHGEFARQAWGEPALAAK